jgi:single-stranded-DNA-specific exonuclease
VRRGYADPDAARAFLAAESARARTRSSSGTCRAACDRIRAAVAAGTRICVHGDYDVDGICATALAVLTLRRLGADVVVAPAEPLRRGLRRQRGHDRPLAGDGVRARPDGRLRDHGGREVAEAKALGLDVVVTDHHRPETSCPTARSSRRGRPLPFPELCGTGVVYKLAEAARRRRLQRTLDLVALADDRRCRPARGREPLARLGRPARAGTDAERGLQALMATAGVDPAAVDAGAVGFRLAPRINAAGRLGHPGIALDLLLTEDRAEAEAARR